MESQGARRSVDGMRRMLTGSTALLLAVGALTGCSGSDGDDDPTPVGGINGPARVDPSTGEADNNSGDD